MLFGDLQVAVYGNHAAFKRGVGGGVPRGVEFFGGSSNHAMECGVAGTFMRNVFGVDSFYGVVVVIGVLNDAGAIHGDLGGIFY